MTTFSAILGLFLLGGCADSPLSPDEKDPAIPAPISSFTYGTPPSLEDDAQQLSPSDRLAMLKGMMNMNFNFAEAVKLADDWQSAHAKVQALLQKPSNVPMYFREQAAARAMLDNWLLEDYIEGREEALGFYTELLIKNQNPEARLTLPALTKLRGHWSPERIEHAALVASKAAHQEYGESTSKSLTAKISEATANFKTRHRYETIQAADELKRMSASAAK